MNDRIKELNDIIIDDWANMGSIIHEMSAENVNKLEPLIQDLIKRNVELAEVSKMTKI